MRIEGDRRRLAVAAVMTVITAVLHTVGNLSPPREVAERLGTLRAQMQQALVPFGLGLTPSAWDIQRSLVFTMSVCLFTIGSLALLVAVDLEASGRLRMRTAGVGTVGSAALTMIYWRYGIAPPLVMLGAVTLAFAYAWAAINKREVRRA